MNPRLAKCLLVAKVLVADGMMTDEERSFLATLMTAYGLDDDEQRRVIDLEGWDEAEQVLRALPLEQRLALIEQLVDAASADGRLTAQELAAIQQVSRELDVGS